jgi:hypothetical protein
LRQARDFRIEGFHQACMFDGIDPPDGELLERLVPPCRALAPPLLLRLP